MPHRTPPADPERINAHDDAETAYWCARLDCTEGELREAVSAVGVMADDVRMHLSQRH